MMSETINAIKNTGAAMKGQLTMKPEQLAPAQLEKAKGLAKWMTSLRQFSYVIISLLGCSGGSIYFVRDVVGLDNVLYWPFAILTIICFITFFIFKFRDYMRGTI